MASRAESLVRELLADRPVAYKPMLAKALRSATAGIWLSQLMYWSDKGTRVGWIYKTREDWAEETGLSLREVDNARAVARAAGVVVERLTGVPARLHYQVQWERLQELLCSFPESEKPVSRKTGNLSGGKQETGLPEPGKLASRTTGILSPGIAETSESTAEITSQSTREKSAAQEEPRPSTRQLARLWDDAKALLEPTIGRAAFVWLREATIGALQDGEIVIAVASPQAQEMATARLRRAVREALEQVGVEAEPRFVVREALPMAPEPVPVAAPGPDLAELWQAVLDQLEAEGINVSQFGGARLQAIERVDDECQRAVIVSPRRIDPGVLAGPVASALSQATGGRYLAHFLTA